MDETHVDVLADIALIIKINLGDTKITTNTIQTILLEAMELVEEMTISGSEKRDNVVIIVKSLIDDLVDDEDERELILDMIEHRFLENTIELIIKVSRGKINITDKKTQKKLLNCMSILFRSIIQLMTKCKKTNIKEVEQNIKMENIKMEQDNV